MYLLFFRGTILFFILPLIGQAVAIAAANHLFGPKGATEGVKGALQKVSAADRVNAIDVPAQVVVESLFPRSVDLWSFTSRAINNAKAQSSGNILTDLVWLAKTSAKFVGNAINEEAGISSEPVNPKKLPNFLHSSERANKIINGIQCDDKIRYEVFSLSQPAYRLMGITLLVSSILVIACIIYLLAKYISIKATKKAKKELNNLKFTSSIPFQQGSMSPEEDFELIRVAKPKKFKQFTTFP